MDLSRSEALIQATVAIEDGAPVWRIIWKGHPADDYQVLKLSAEDYPPGSVLILKGPPPCSST